MAVQRDKVIASAEKLVLKGKIEPAIKEYERLLDDNPNDVNTLNRIGDLWVRISRNDEAVKTFSRIAEHYSKDGFFLKAIAIYKKINKLDPSKLDIYARLADLYAKQGLAMEAKSQYQVLADYYLKHGDPQNALGIYKKISELDPNSINVHVKLADLHSQVGHTAEALKEYDRVGRMLLKRGMLDEAVQVFRKALKIDGKNLELVESLVTALIEAKDFDNAKQIVETALEANRDNPRLLAMWGKILVGKGDLASARTALERGLHADANDPSIREALADLYLKQNDPARALEMLVPLVERAVGKGERGSAVEMLNRVLRVDQRHTQTLERLVALYTRLNEETNILSSMNLLAEAHIARNQWQESATVLEKLIQREPQNAQHRTKLQFVRSNMPGGAAPAAPVRPKTVTEVAVPMEIEEPVPSFESVEEEPPALSLDLDSTPGIDLDFSVQSSSAAGALSLEPEPGGIGAVEEGTDDLDFITEHLTEAEVFAKYGLAEKAAEHLRAVIDRAPNHHAAHERLFRILLDEGDVEGARSAANQYIVILQELGDTDTIDIVQNEFLSRGHTFSPSGRPRPAPHLEPEPALEGDALLASELAEEPEIRFELEPGSADVEVEIEEISAEFPTEVTEEPLLEVAPTDEPAFEDSGLEIETELETEPALELVEEPLLELTLEPELAPEPEPEPVLEEASPLELEFEAESAAEPLELGTEPVAEPLGELEPELLADEIPEPLAETPAPEAPVPEEPVFFGVESLADEIGTEISETPSQDALAEVDFYSEQELYDEARQKASALLERFPDDPHVLTRMAGIEQAIAAAAAAAAKAAPPSPPPPPKTLSRPSTLSHEEIESELLSAIPDDDEDLGIIAAPPPPAVAPEQPAVPFATKPAEEGNLFADEDDFFDLAAELESELNDENDVVSLSEEEQSLEEIFKEFKKGVEQQLDSEDYDTHYNLGIAYKEMGLIDEAIGEFQLASKDPKRAVECASMLGLCFLEKGMPQLAIKWYRKGLEMPEITEEEHVGLLYDLGSAFVEVGDTTNAQKAFMEVYGLNSNYRDIVGRIKQLEDAGRRS